VWWVWYFTQQLQLWEDVLKRDGAESRLDSQNERTSRNFRTVIVAKKETIKSIQDWLLEQT